MIKQTKLVKKQHCFWCLKTFFFLLVEVNILACFFHFWLTSCSFLPMRNISLFVRSEVHRKVLKTIRMAQYVEPNLMSRWRLPPGPPLVVDVPCGRSVVGGSVWSAWIVNRSHRDGSASPKRLDCCRENKGFRVARHRAIPYMPNIVCVLCLGYSRVVWQ